MSYYLLEYALVENYLDRRAAFRETHLALAREAHRRGDLILAGALAEPADHGVTARMTTTREQFSKVSVVAGSRSPATAFGSATSASQRSFQADSNSNTGSSLTG